MECGPDEEAYREPFDGLDFHDVLILLVLISERMERLVARAVLTLPYLPRASFIPRR